MPNKQNMANTQSALKTETTDAIVCMAKTHDLSNVKSIWNQCIKNEISTSLQNDSAIVGSPSVQWKTKSKQLSAKAGSVLSGLTMNPNMATLCFAHHIDLNYIHEHNDEDAPILFEDDPNLHYYQDELPLKVYLQTHMEFVIFHWS
jgi:hypothetical protein